VIRHRPFGSEHPYATTPDQRVPARPETGDTVVLGVRAAAGVTAVDLEWAPTGGAALHLPLERVVPAAADLAAAAGGEGHLAAAQARGAGDDGRTWQVTSPAVLGAARYRFVGHRGADTRRTRWYDVTPAEWTAEPAGTLDVPTDRLVADSVRWRVAGGRPDRVRFALRLENIEHVVGFGERFDALDQRGRALDAVVFEQYKQQGVHGRTYLPMPFAHVVAESGPGWGFHVRTARRSWYDVAASTPDRLVVEVELGGTDELAVAIYSGTPTEVLAAFTAEVGRAEELPDWVFRLWASGNEWNTQAIVQDRMDKHAELDIPVGAIVIEAWSDEEGITIFRDAQYAVNEDGTAHAAGDFTYTGAWPDPKAMIDELHRRGIKVILWQIPLQKMRPHPRGQARADADAMIRDGLAVLEADGRPYRNRGWWFPQALMPDLSTDRGRDWWTAKRRYLVADLDVDGFKTDGGEHAWGHDLRYADGSRGDEGNNRFPVHYARAFGDLLRSEGKAPVTFSRAGFTGSQAHGVFWAGDEDSTWAAYRASMTAGLTASACGIVYWGWDLAGFSGPVPDAELYLRATAASTFLPIMQYHSEFNHHRAPLRDRTPWHVAATTGDDRVIDVFRRFATLREALLPYLSAAAATSVKTGAPLMRALFFDSPDDPQVWAHPGEFRLGADLLVHPVTEPGATSWRTYLPAGDWVDVFTGRAVPGGAVDEREVPIDEVPVYATAAAWPGLRALFAGVQR
jgi:1,3-alpha-isomaltosidase